MSQERKYVILRKATPTLQASDLDGLVARLNDIAEHDWRVSFLAHTSDTAAEATSALQSLSAQLAAAEANLAAANKQIEEMRGARERAIEECARVAGGGKILITGQYADHLAGYNNGRREAAEAIRALSHEAHNGTDTGAGDAR